MSSLMKLNVMEWQVSWILWNILCRPLFRLIVTATVSAWVKICFCFLFFLPYLLCPWSPDLSHFLSHDVSYPHRLRLMPKTTNNQSSLLKHDLTPFHTSMPSSALSLLQINQPTNSKFLFQNCIPNAALPIRYGYPKWLFVYWSILNYILLRYSFLWFR